MGEDEDLDWSKVVARMREAREKSRGYASFFEWAPDRKLEELEVTRLLRNFLALSEPVDFEAAELNPNDPPDAHVRAGGRLLGVEVTELVDGKTLQRHRQRKKLGSSEPYDWAAWTPISVAEALSAAVMRKDAKLANSQPQYDELIVAIFTDEPMITQDFVEAALEHIAVHVQHVGRAFLVISYDPSADTTVFPDGCPVLSIPLVRAKDARR